jgi:hypothetical protein
MRAKYVLSEVMVGLWRNVTMTIAMIITMAVSLTMLGASLVMYKQIDTMKQRFIGNVQVSIFLTVDPPATAEQTAALQDQISKDPLIKSWKFVSQDQAYAEFQSQHKNDSPQLVKLTTPAELPASILRRSFPLMMRAMSRRSSMSRSWDIALRSMISSACARERMDGCVRRMRVQPITALSGVRISWDSVARNSSFRREESSAS